LSDSAFCFHHDPARAAERQQARMKGGKARSKPATVLPLTTPEARVEDVAGVVRLLGETIHQARTGALDTKVAQVTGYLSGILLKALEGAELAAKIDQQAAEIAALKGDMETMRRERNAHKAMAALANGAGSAATGREAEPTTRSDSGRRGGNLPPSEPADDSRYLAGDLAPFFE
jgi:hypothetical protein